MDNKNKKEESIDQTPLEVEIMRVAMELLIVLNDNNHNYNIQDFDLEDRARAFASTFPLLFKVSFNSHDKLVEDQKKH